MNPEPHVPVRTPVGFWLAPCIVAGSILAVALPIGIAFLVEWMAGRG